MTDIIIHDITIDEFAEYDHEGIGYLIGTGRVDVMDEQPTIDAVPVVRCKDCYWWEHKNDEIQGLCRLSKAHPTGKWYCADGTRKKKFKECGRRRDS